MKLLPCSGIGALSACSLTLDGALVRPVETLRDLVDLGDSLFDALCIVKELPGLIELGSSLLLEVRLVDNELFRLICLLLLLCMLRLAEPCERCRYVRIVVGIA